MSTTLSAVTERFIDEVCAETGKEFAIYGTADSVGAQSLTHALFFEDTGLGSGSFMNDYKWLERPTTTTPADIVRPIAGLTNSTGAIAQGGAAYTDQTVKYYRLWPEDWHPRRYVVGLANRALETAWEWWRTPVSMVADSDMEQSGVASLWTGTNCTPTKSTTTVYGGTQSLSAAVSVANGYAQSNTFEAGPERSFRLTCKVRVPSGTAVVQVIDVSHSNAVLASSNVTVYNHWQDVMLVGTFPAGCTQAAVRLGATSAITPFFDEVVLYWNLCTTVPLQSWIDRWRTEDGSEAIRIYEAVNRLGTIDSWSSRSYDLRPVDPSKYQIVRQPSANGGALQLELGRQLSYWMWPLIIEARRPFKDGSFGRTGVSADTDTSGIDVRLWVAAMKMIAAREKSMPQLQVWTAEYEREQRRGESKLTSPAPDGRGLSWVRLG